MDQDTLRFLLREAVRETVTEVLQTVLELDRTAFLQAHGGRRNGYYPRKLETTFGQVDLKVPRDREGQYYPAFLKPYARRLVDVGEVAVALYATGVSQRKAAEVMSLFGAPAPNEPPPGPPLLPRDHQRHDRGGAPGSGGLPQAALARGDGLRLPGRPVPEASEGRGGRGQGRGVRGPGGHAFRGEAGPGLLAPAGGERLGVGGGPGGAVAAGAQAGAALHHRWASGSTRSHPKGLPSGGVAAVRGARGAVEPGAGAGQRPDPLGGRPEAGVRGGEPGGGS
jgi:hypothetical protein